MSIDKKMNNSKKYLLSFTAAGLMLNESIIIANEYLRLKEWNLVNQAYKENNLLQSRTTSRNLRVFQEIKKRLRLLTFDQIHTLSEVNVQDQKYILWYVICERYQFIREFAVEVVHEKFLLMKSKIEDIDFDGFFIQKTDWHPELDNITLSTKLKLKTVLFRMLRETGILSDQHQIIPVVPSVRVVNFIQEDDSIGLEIFPTHFGEKFRTSAEGIIPLTEKENKKLTADFLKRLGDKS